MKKRLTNKDQKLVDFIIANPDMSETACVIACGWKQGSCSRTLARIRPYLDARKEANSAKIDKGLVKEICKFEALKELADMAQSWRKSKYGVNSAHVRAAELYLHNTGQTPEAKKIMADIAVRASGEAMRTEGDFEPEWARKNVVN